MEIAESKWDDVCVIVVYVAGSLSVKFDQTTPTS